MSAYETLGRITRIESALGSMQRAIDTLNAELADLKRTKPVTTPAPLRQTPPRQTLTLRKNGG